MWRINSTQLALKITLITDFMCDKSKNNKTFGELVDLFNKCYKNYTNEMDNSNDLRILEFVKDMKNDKWSDPIYIICENGEVKDGVHRGIAYLLCIQEGFPKNKLPEVFINEPVI